MIHRAASLALASAMFFCMGSFLPAQGQKDQDANQTPLGAVDIATLLAVGAEEADIIKSLQARGFASSLDSMARSGFQKLGATKTLLEAIAAAPAGPSTPTFRGQLMRDPRASVTWYLPAGFQFAATPEGGRVVIGGLPASTTLDLSWTVLDLPAANLRARSIRRVAEWQELRLAEIEKKEGKNWRRIGAWPITGLGWSGRHTVYENEAGSPQPLTFCLTWFVHDQKLISIRTLLKESELRPRHDEIVDRITRFLRCSGPGIRDRKTWVRRMQQRSAATWLLVSSEGELSTWQPESATTLPFGGRGYTQATWAGHYDSIIGSKDGKLVRRRRGSTKDEIIHPELPGLPQDLGVSSLGDQIYLERLVATVNAQKLQHRRQIFRLRPEEKELELWPAPFSKDQTLGMPTFTKARWWWAQSPSDGKTMTWCASAQDKQAATTSLPIPAKVNRSSTVTDGQALFTLTSEVDEKESRFIRILAFEDPTQHSGRELFRMPIDKDQAPIQLRMGLHHETLILVIPGQGAYEISKRGGLLLERLADLNLRDARVGL
ncbi:MAG: hypothetical protein V3W41_12690 [Planctomycetota bacterium]